MKEKKKQLYFHIPKPCDQRWDVMPLENNGRHCSQCDKTIIDFSQLSDEALFNFFHQNPGVHCGRFHNEQLDRLITAPARNHKAFWYTSAWFRNAVAFISGVLLFRQPAVAGDKLKAAIYQQNPEKKPGVPTTDSLVLSGYVTDEHNKALHKVKIVLDENHVTETDEKGMFSLSVKRESLLKQSYPKLYFSYEGYDTEVRSYHLAMGSATFNVQLLPPSKGYTTMGAMADPAISDLPEIAFKPGITKLDEVDKQALDHVAYKLKSNPSAAIRLKAYLPKRGGNVSIAAKRLFVIKKYLVDSQGISADRIMTETESDGGNINIVDILNQ